MLMISLNRFLSLQPTVLSNFLMPFSFLNLCGEKYDFINRGLFGLFIVSKENTNRAISVISMRQINGYGVAATAPFA
jgi:hypothetical protein